MNYLIDLIFPRRCPMCGDVVTPKGNLSCPPCKSKLKLVCQPKCKKCGKQVEFEEQEFCFDCDKKEYMYSYGISLWEYDKTMKKSISDFKYNGRREYVDFYVEEIIKHYKDEILRISPDVLVPVPIHKDKLIDRGYNQAEILSRAIGKKLDIISLANLLLRDKKTLPQKQLNDKERFKNLQRAFAFSSKERQKYKGPINTVLLVDDIYTTGSTIEACTRILLNNGVKEVYFVSICIGKGF